jgi:rhodanese-related sulfurtransferase
VASLPLKQTPTDPDQRRSSTMPSAIRRAWQQRSEIALLDVREEALHAEGHPLFAANLPISTLELDAPIRLPRRAVPIVVFDNGEGLAQIAVDRLNSLGYPNVSVLEGGLQGWRDAGYEVFRDVNSPSKAFGELVGAKCHTPSLSAEEVKGLIETHAEVVIADARRFDEYQTMSIPTAISVPGGELVYRLQQNSERPSTRIIVNCAGRTRSIIGTQSLINAGLPNPIAALRNGTIGWKLAGFTLNHGATAAAAAPASLSISQASAQRVSDAAGVRRTSRAELAEWLKQNDRTIYRFDVRTPAEFAQGHLDGFRSAPGGQLIQEADMFAAVRGARIVLADTDGVRANMTASWLAQMNWEVYVVDGAQASDFRPDRPADDPDSLPVVPPESWISAATLHEWIESGRINSSDVALLDFARSREYAKGHIAGAQFALRSRTDEALQATAQAHVYVLTSPTDAMSRLAWAGVTRTTAKQAYVLAGGTQAWKAAGYALDSQSNNFASQPVDYYRRPYEGTDAPQSAMEAYLNWEYGLVEQLERDQSHGFWVLQTK